MAASSLPFRCRVCGNDSYVPIHVARPSGSWYRTPFYRCFKCSTMFTDPEQFGRNPVTGDGLDRSPRSFKRG